MPRRQTKSRSHRLPGLWLFTDERVTNDTLLSAVWALPRGSGIVFRHYRTPPPIRRALFEQIRVVAKRRRLMLLLAGTGAEAAAWRADGYHMGSVPRRVGGAPGGVRTASAHGAADIRAAERAGVDMVFLSPIFPTRTHPGASALEPLRFGLAVRGARMPVAALGGMTPARFRRLRRLGAYGWAAIDGLTSLKS